MTDQTETQPSRTVVVRDYKDADMDGRWRYSQSLAQAGNLLPASMRDPATGQFSPGRVYLIAETGSMLGLHPMAALAGINVIEGKPAASAALMSAVVRAAGHKLRVRESGTVEGGDYSVTTTLIRSDDPDEPFTSIWTPHRAARAGLCTYIKGQNGIWQVRASSKQGNPLPWQLYTESLCKARSMSEVTRDGGQDVLMGVRYTPEELGAAIDANGEVIDGEPANISSLPAEVPASAPLPQTAKPGRKRPTRGTQGTKVAEAPQSPAEAPEPADEPQAPAEPQPSVAEQIATVESADLPPIHHDGATGEVIEPEADKVNEAGLTAAEEAEARAASAKALDGQAERDAEREARLARLAEAESHMRDNDRPEPEEVRAAVEAEMAQPEPWAEPSVDPEWALPGEVEQMQRAHAAVMARNPNDWPNLLKTATTPDECKDVWDRGSAAGEMTTELRAETFAHRDRTTALQAELAAGPVTDGLI